MPTTTRIPLCVALCVAWLATSVLAADAPPPALQAPPGAKVTQPHITQLDGGRVAIGAIIVDRQARSFTVPGTVIRVDPPLEYAAVRKGGHKAYESLLELDVDAFEFNLACILVGLDAARATLPRWHFDPEPVRGDEVELSVSWTADGVRVKRPLTALLTGAEPQPGGWIYTGSQFDRLGDYLPQLNGTLVGFAHDPDSIIEHRLGLGLGNYGAVGAPGAPPVGTPVTLELRFAAGT
jgi:hypothetical protein